MYSSNAQPTGTNRPRACPTNIQPRQHRLNLQLQSQTARVHEGIQDNWIRLDTGKVASAAHGEDSRERPARVTAALARGKYPVPSRTRKSSLSAPMVLQPGGCGRVGRRRTFFRQTLRWRTWHLGLRGGVPTPSAISGASCLARSVRLGHDVAADAAPQPCGRPARSPSTGRRRCAPVLSAAAGSVVRGGDVR